MAVTTPISPKVTAATVTSAITGLFLTVVVAALNSVTPDLFHALGPWSGVVFTAVIAGGTYLSGYLTTDHLRTAGQALKDATTPDPSIFGTVEHPAPAIEAPTSFLATSGEVAAPTDGTFGAPSAGVTQP